MNGFTKAERKKAKLRLGLTGASGSGKTYSALQIAKGMGGRIALIDTEHGSASLYSNDFDFDTLELDAPYAPERFIQAIELAEQSGYDVIIIDSLTHEWTGKGGCLQINDEFAKTVMKGNSYMAWSHTTPRHQALIEKISSSKCHIIATMRSKTERVQEGKKVITLGMKPEQRDGIEYEFTTFLDLFHETHQAIASKDRTGLFNPESPFLVTPEVGTALLDWLNTGVSVYIDKAQEGELLSIYSNLPESSKMALKQKHPSPTPDLEIDFTGVKVANFDKAKEYMLTIIEKTKQEEAT